MITIANILSGLWVASMSWALIERRSRKRTEGALEVAKSIIDKQAKELRAARGDVSELVINPDGPTSMMIRMRVRMQVQGEHMVWFGQHESGDGKTGGIFSQMESQ